jgi:hypothetical protein
MDPYIEASGLWADFHDDLIAEIKRSLADRLPDRYFVQTGERSYILLAREADKESRPIYPDIGIEKQEMKRRGSKSALAVAEPVLHTGGIAMRAFIDEHFRESFIEIYEARPGPRLVTCIEVLSPANKQGGKRGWRLYLRKRNALLLGKANLVEIDLVRGGRRMPMVEAWPKSPYYLLVGREGHVPYCRVWATYFDQPLPEIPVPLASPDADLTLALQPMIDAIYERSRYGRRIDYGKPLDPPLTQKETTWLKRQVRERDRQA